MLIVDTWEKMVTLCLTWVLAFTSCCSGTMAANMKKRYLPRSENRGHAWELFFNREIYRTFLFALVLWPYKINPRPGTNVTLAARTLAPNVAHGYWGCCLLKSEVFFPAFEKPVIVLNSTVGFLLPSDLSAVYIITCWFKEALSSSSLH